MSIVFAVQNERKSFVEWARSASECAGTWLRNFVAMPREVRVYTRTVLIFFASFVPGTGTWYLVLYSTCHVKYGKHCYRTCHVEYGLLYLSR